MADRYAKQFAFTYPYMVMARVFGVYAIDGKVLVDATALDGRGTWQKVPVALPPGVTRNYRKGQIVGLLFRHSASNYPTAVAHLYNLETAEKTRNPLPPPAVFGYVDDQVYFHPETGAHLRFRSTTSTATAGGGDKQPGIAEITMATGATFTIEETDATHAKASLLLPSGAFITIDSEGTVTIHSPTKVIVESSDVELGQDNAKAAANATARQADLDSLVQQVNAFETIFNAHIHGGVMGGSSDTSTSLTTATTVTTPPCSAVVFTE